MFSFTRPSMKNLHYDTGLKVLTHEIVTTDYY